MTDFRCLFKNSHVSAIAVTSDVNRRYFTDFLSHNSTLLLTADKAWFFVDKRYSEEAFIRLSAETDIEVVETDSKDTLSVMAEFVGSRGFDSLGFEDGRMTYAQYVTLKDIVPNLVTIGRSVEELRQVKSKEELKRIKNAAKITEDTFLWVLGLFKEGITEKDVADELVYRMRRLGADSEAFDPIVAFDKNTSCPHHACGDRRLKLNDVVTVDMGAKYKGYSADMTRSFVFGSKVDPEYKKIHDEVAKAQGIVLDNLKAGISGIEADAFARDYLESVGLGEYFTHSCGHSVGLEVHENPSLTSNAQDKFVSGNVVTVEPGVYMAGKYGVRIEDMVLVKDDGVENFYKVSKEIFII